MKLHCWDHFFEDFKNSASTLLEVHHPVLQHMLSFLHQEFSIYILTQTSWIFKMGSFVNIILKSALWDNVGQESVLVFQNYPTWKWIKQCFHLQVQLFEEDHWESLISKVTTLLIKCIPLEMRARVKRILIKNSAEYKWHLISKAILIQELSVKATWSILRFSINKSYNTKAAF